MTELPAEMADLDERLRCGEEVHVDVAEFANFLFSNNANVLVFRETLE